MILPGFLRCCCPGFDKLPTSERDPSNHCTNRFLQLHFLCHQVAVQFFTVINHNLLLLLLRRIPTGWKTQMSTKWLSQTNNTRFSFVQKHSPDKLTLCESPQSPAPGCVNLHSQTISQPGGLFSLPTSTDAQASRPKCQLLLQLDCRTRYRISLQPRSQHCRPETANYARNFTFSTYSFSLVDNWYVRE